MVPALVLAATLATAGALTVDTQSRTVSLPPGRGLTLEITVGDVRIVGEARQDALIEIVRRVPRAEALKRIPIVIEETPAEVRITAIQQAGETDPALRTDVTLRVPHTSSLRSIRLLEGRLRLGALRGLVTADVRRGSIDAADIEGILRLETGIGDITADRARLSPGGLLRLRAFNGDVRLTLATRPRDARVMALALNGSIRSDIPLAMKDSWGPRWGEATLGTGEPVISIDVITGAIEIRAPQGR